MKRLIRTMTLLSCITAATAFTGQSAFADYGFSGDRPGAGSGQQQKHKGHKGHRKGDFFKKMARELNLSEQQQAEARSIFEQARAEHKPLAEAMGGERRKLESLVHSGNADEAAIRAQASKVASLQSDLAVLRGQQAKRFVALLTPDQAAKLKDLREKGKGKGKGNFRGFAGCPQEPQP